MKPALLLKEQAMTFLDQAMRKAFARRDQPALEPSPLGAATSLTSNDVKATSTGRRASAAGQSMNSVHRELFLDAPENRLRGSHRPPEHSIEPQAKSAEPVLPIVAAPDVTEALGAVTNSLLSYELSVIGPSLDEWPISDVMPASSLANQSIPRGRGEPARPTQTALPRPFKPSWEADAFHLTPICRAMQSRLQAPLLRAAEELMNHVSAERPVVPISSTRAGAGATGVSIVLARTLAKAGCRVMLIDADEQGDDSPLADQLGVVVEGGWNSLIAAGLDATECCVQSLADGFCVLPMARGTPTTRDAAIRELSPLLRRLVGNFDVVLVDCGRLALEPHHLPHELLSAQIMVKDLRTDNDCPGDPQVNTLLMSTPGGVHVVENFASASAF
jgi:Mrp family chromosome partitioning ATPase